MKVQFARKFSKDIDNVTDSSIKQAIITFIRILEESDNILAIANIKKLRGHKDVYRTSIGDYRLGFFYDNSIITLARFLHRKDIYKYFP